MDGLAVIIAGTEQPALKIMEDMLTRLDYPNESRLLGKGNISLPVELAARWNGLAGHAMDWDDTQLQLNNKVQIHLTKFFGPHPLIQFFEGHV